MERSPQLNFNATTMFRELQELGYRGGYTLVKEAIRPLRETHRQIEAATVRFETPPGLQTQMDSGSKQVMIAGQAIRTHILVLVLSYSRACYVEFTLDEKLPTLIDGLAMKGHFSGLVRHSGRNLIRQSPDYCVRSWHIERPS